MAKVRSWGCVELELRPGMARIETPVGLRWGKALLLGRSNRRTVLPLATALQEKTQTEMVFSSRVFSSRYIITVMKPSQRCQVRSGRNHRASQAKEGLGK